MRRILFIFVVVLIMVPTSVFAICSDTGATVVYVNGILNTKKEADESTGKLKQYFQSKFKDSNIAFITGYNPSNIGGAGDLLQSAAQIMGGSITDHDLVTILTQIQPQISTRKILLVGHSQGTFYTNEMYRYLIAHGVPKESIAVYNVATPAHEVADKGKHLTSSNDSAIQKIKALAQKVNLPLPLPFNIDIPIHPDDAGNDYPGHNFIKAYLAGASDEIVSGVSQALNNLKAQSSTDICFVAPRLTMGYQADSITIGLFNLITTNPTTTFVRPIQAYFQPAATNLVTNIANALMSLFSGASQNTALLTASALPLVSQQTPIQPVQTNSATPTQEAVIQNQIPTTLVQTAPTVILQEPVIIQQSVASQIPATSTIDISLVVATSTPQEVVVFATSTDVVIAPQPPVYLGGGWVSGVSNDAPLISTQKEIVPEQAAISTEDNTASSTADIVFATSTPDIVSTSTPEVIVSLIDPVSTTTTPVIENTDPNPVVINEIAWMGTKAQANDEWIELYNRSDVAVDLNGWTLESKNKALSIKLTGNISSHSYFLLERTASTTTDRGEDMVYVGALNNSGPDANLYLKNGTTTIDKVEFGYWPFGNNSTKHTMERVSPYATSTLDYNWKTYSESLIAPFAKDAQGNDIFGTPGAKNSVSGFYTPAGSVTENTVWYKKHSPYYIPGTIIITKGSTLTIEPGVVVKFAKGAPYGGGIDVRGVLLSEGTVGNPITFTSFLDDASDGVDSNQNGSATTPASADWMSINFYNTQEPSKIQYTQIRYGGQGINYNPNGWYPTYTGVVGIYGASPEISDSTFSFNNTVSLYIKDGAHPVLLRNTISETAISKHQGVNPGGYGIQIADASSTADIIGNVFIKNVLAIISESTSNTSLIVKDNIFTDNARNGEFNGYTNFNLENAGNSDTNHKGGFYISFYVKDGQQKTLRDDSMPYIVKGGITVGVGGILLVEKGVILKSAPNPQAPAVPVIIYGILKAEGTMDQPIVFTSLADDSDGYDSNYSSTNPVSGDWQNIQFIGATSSDSVLDYVTISYGGRGTNMCPYAYLAGPCMEYPGAVVIENSSPTISHSQFISNHAPDYVVKGNANPILIDNTFQ